MRLLHRDASDRLILTDFRSKSIPPYAILSHRWSDSEILIEDILGGTYKEKGESYRKLSFCAKQAAKDRLQYFWVDTCCIDKWDKDELSTAINSMFHWYQNATRCYVFLSDVSLSAVTETVEASYSDWKGPFRASPWFTRGWTLQELIAPVSVEFFSREGRRIGDKASLEQLIHSITSIPLAALRNNPLDQFSTSERTRWVENRITTEEEDIVYCLLGLLDVSMPVTYGEGQESARRRLQAELETTGSAPSLIPFSRNESFVGRELQLAELEAKLFSNDQTTTTLAIAGLGGTGKSQLALEVSHRTRLKKKDCSVFWMDASDASSLYRSYASVAQKLTILGCDDDRADIKQIVKRCVAEICTRQCLLIFDNVEEKNVRPSGPSSTGEAALLADFLVHSKLCSIIFTTTESDTAEALAPQNVTMLHELTPDAALRMLQNRLTSPLSDVEQQTAMCLLRDVLYLPLAVVQAAACINASGMTVQQYQAQLNKHYEAAFEYSDNSCEDEQRRSCLKQTVAATLSLSLGQVRQSYLMAAEYLYLAACVDRQDISLEFLKAASPQAREDAIKVLDKYALVSRRPAESALDIHRLVHQVLREQLQAEGRYEEWCQRTITQLLQVFPTSHHNNRSKWRRLLPHVQLVLSHVQREDDEESLDLAWRCASTLYSDGRFEEAEELQLQVMQTRKRVRGDEHPDTLTSMNNLANALYSQGKYKAAEVTYRQTLAAREKALGREHLDTLTSINNLASVLYSQGKHEAAEAMHRQTLAAREKALGREHPDTLMSISNLAGMLYSQGKHEEAEVMHRQTLAVSEQVLGREHPDTLTSMNYLANALYSQGKYKAAEAMYRQTLAAREKALGREHPDTLTSINNLASVLDSQGKRKEAEAMHRQTLAARERALGREHPDTLMSMSNVASMLYSQGKHEEAEVMHRQTLAAREKALGREHPDTLASINCLANTLYSQGKHEEAEVMYRQTLAAREKALGREHPDTLTSMNNLASLLDRQGKHAAAEAMYRQTLAAKEKVLGREHPDTLTSVNNLASVLYSQGKHKAAEAMYRQTLAARERALGREHPDTLMSINNLASLLDRQGKHEAAEVMHRQTLAAREKALGREHPDTLTSINYLANALYSQGKHKEAEAVHR